ELRIRIGEKVGAAAGVERSPVVALVEALEDAAAAAGDAEVEVARIARVDEYRVQLRAVGGTALRVVARPFGVHGVLVEAGDRFPGVAGVFRAEEALR